MRSPSRKSPRPPCRSHLLQPSHPQTGFIVMVHILQSLQHPLTFSSSSGLTSTLTQRFTTCLFGKQSLIFLAHLGASFWAAHYFSVISVIFCEKIKFCDFGPEPCRQVRQFPPKVSKASRTGLLRLQPLIAIDNTLRHSSLKWNERN